MYGPGQPSRPCSRCIDAADMTASAWSRRVPAVAPRRRDKLVLIDLDKACSPASGAIEPWAQPILEAAIKERAFVELTPSGTGFHIIGEGPQGFAGRKAHNVELYCSQRFFTMTGKLLSGPGQHVLGTLDHTIKVVAARLGIPKPTDRPVPQHGAAAVGVRPYLDTWTDQDILEVAFTKHNGDKLRRLLGGDTRDYAGQSEADMACATMLGFWFWLDGDAVERVMRASALCRDKWDTRRSKLTYLRFTINRALDGREDYYGKPCRVVTNNSNAWVRV